MFSNGEKFNPLSMEQVIESHPRLRSGSGWAGEIPDFCDYRTCNTSELSKEEKIKVIEEIWPTVEEGNREAPKHAKLPRD